VTLRSTPTSLLLTSTLLLGACQQPSDTVANAAPAPSPADAWIGNWTGPEGTALEVIGADHGYRISIQSLNGRSYYDAKWVDNRPRSRAPAGPNPSAAPTAPAPARNGSPTNTTA
jgi:hypothetical protein